MSFSPEDVREAMSNHTNIRNMSVIAHVDHGKTTLTDSLVNKAGIISDKDTGTKCIMDTEKQEQDRGITIKSTGISLHYTLPDDKLPKDANGNKFLINLIDSPGHVDFSSEVTAALRVTDGALVVVDSVEGACVQTETVLRQALMERIKPVLMINKVDKLLFGKEFNATECFEHFTKLIQSINVIISTYQNDKTLGDVQFSPDKCNVAFGSGLYAWGFTLNTFAEFWERLTGKPKDKWLKYMWGGWYYDKEGKKYTTNDGGGKNEPGFVKLVMTPILQLKEIVENQDHAKLKKFIKNIDVKLTSEDYEKSPKDLLNYVLRKWFPASDALLEMIVQKLPSPDQAQKYRAECFYKGDLDSEVGKGIVNCDPEGPLMMYVSKMVPNKDRSRFYAFGRVFSGTIKGGQKVCIYGSKYEKGSDIDYFKDKAIQRTYVMMGAKMEAIEACPAGNTVTLSGVDKYILKNGTISSLDDVTPFEGMKFSVSPVVRIAVEPKNPKDIPKFIDALKKLGKSDPLCQIHVDAETGEMVVAGAGELHLEVIMNNLKEDFCKNIPFNVSEPVVPFRETVTKCSEITCLAKSPNKHNRLYMTAEPLSEELIKDIEDGKLKDLDEKARIRFLVDEHGWNPNDARKVWGFGPEGTGANMVVDQTTGVQYLNEIKDSVMTAFQWVTSQGVLCEEPMRGIRFNIQDVTLHADNIHRGGGQIIPTARRVFYACQYTCKPSLMEPIFLVDITCPDSVCSNVYNVLSQRRGQIFEHNTVEGTPMIKLKAYLPVMESFGFDAFLRSETGGQAFPQCVFSHWEIMSGDTDDENSKVSHVYREVRKRKGHPEELPPLDRYMDKL